MLTCLDSLPIMTAVVMPGANMSTRVRIKILISLFKNLRLFLLNAQQSYCGMSDTCLVSFVFHCSIMLVLLLVGGEHVILPLQEDVWCVCNVRTTVQIFVEMYVNVSNVHVV